MPGVNNTKRIPCSRNPKDHGHHPSSETCPWCDVRPFADTLPFVSEYDPYDDMIYKLWCGLSEWDQTDVLGTRTRLDDEYIMGDHLIPGDIFRKMLKRDLKENPSP